MWTKINKDLTYNEMLKIACGNEQVKLGEHPWFILKVGKRRFIKFMFTDYVYDGDY